MEDRVKLVDRGPQQKEPRGRFILVTRDCIVKSRGTEGGKLKYLVARIGVPITSKTRSKPGKAER